MLSSELRTTLAGLADILIPAAHGMPSASEVGVHTKWVDRALAARPDLRSDFVAALEAGALDALAPAQRDAFGHVVLGAYYLSPRVRRLLGYRGTKPFPLYPDEADYYLAGDVLGPVTRRGPVYRPTPSEQRS